MNKIKLTFTVLFSLAIASVASAAENRVGISAQFHSFDTSGSEVLRQSGQISRTSHSNDVVVPSLFVEHMMDSGLGFGFDFVPVAELGSKSRADDDAETAGGNKAAAELATHVTAYVILESANGFYGKLGMAYADVETTEVLGTGDTYGDTSTDGPMIGLGYSYDVGSYFVRGDVSQTWYDSVKLTSTGGSTVEADLETTAFTFSVGRAF